MEIDCVISLQRVGWLVSFGTCIINPNSLSYSHGFVGLVPFDSASVREGLAPLPSWTSWISSVAMYTWCSPDLSLGLSSWPICCVTRIDEVEIVPFTVEAQGRLHLGWASDGLNTLKLASMDIFGQDGGHREDSWPTCGFGQKLRFTAPKTRRWENSNPAGTQQCICL